MNYKKFRKDLFTFRSERLSKLAMFLIVLLDIFVLGLVFEGIDYEQEKNQKINAKFPYHCSYLFDKNIENVEDYAKYRNVKKYSYNYKRGESAKVCEDISKKYDELLNDKEFSKNKTLYLETKKNLKKVKIKIDDLQRKYNIELLEKSNSEEKNILFTKLEYHLLLEKEKELKNILKNIPKVSSYKQYKKYQSFKNQNKKRYKKELESYIRHYNLKNYLYLLKFTLPLFLIAFFYYYRNNRKRLSDEDYNNITLVMTSHLLVIFTIPIFFGFLNVVYYYIPKEFFVRIIEFLKSISALFLGFYGVLLVAFSLVFFVIYILQKYEKSQYKKHLIINKNVNKNKCVRCRNIVDYRKDENCPFCGERLQIECQDCGNKTINVLEFCRHCGSKSFKDKD